MPLHAFPRRPWALALAGLVLLAAACTAPAPSPTGPGPTPSASPSPTASPSPSPSPTPSPSPSPTPSPVAVVTNGVWLPAAEAALATRHPIAVMIDDQELARPQSGLSSADIIYQAPAEGGIPRYMLIFQAGDPPTIGPIRSARRYFVGWAAEWRAAYVHAGGAPNALQALAALDRKLLWNADAERWGGAEGYAWRISARLPPHNLYSSGAKLEALAARLGATAPFATPAWTFKEPAVLADRPASGSIVVPYQANVIRYRYDRRTNLYVRSTSSASPQLDATTGTVIAPADVVVLFMRIARIPGDTHNRLDVGYLGSGRALVFRDGTLIPARWSKKDDASPTKLLYASGSLKGQPVPLVRGQIAIQVVPIGTAVTWKIGPPVIDHSTAE